MKSFHLLNSFPTILAFLYCTRCSFSDWPYVLPSPVIAVSFNVDKVLNTNVVNLKRKRKLQAEQLGLPIPKHKCWDRICSSEFVSFLDKNPEVEDLHTHIIKDKSDSVPLDGSDPESARDSNSFAEDSDTAMSVHGGKLEPECLKTCTYDQPSTLSVNWGSYSFLDGPYSLESVMRMEKVAVKEGLKWVGGKHNPPQNDGKLQVSHNLDGHIQEFGSHVDYIYPEYINESIDQCTDEELNNLLYSNGGNSNNYVLSSGRWTVNQEVLPSTRKPTIDQEFEEYFATLML